MDSKLLYFLAITGLQESNPYELRSQYYRVSEHISTSTSLYKTQGAFLPSIYPGLK